MNQSISLLIPVSLVLLSLRCAHLWHNIKKVTTKHHTRNLLLCISLSLSLSLSTSLSSLTVKLINAKSKVIFSQLGVFSFHRLHMSGTRKEVIYCCKQSHCVKPDHLSRSRSSLSLWKSFPSRVAAAAFCKMAARLHLDQWV